MNRRHSSRRSTGRAGIALLLAATVAACEGGGRVTGPRGIVRIAGGPQSSSVQGLVGSWRRAVFFVDDFGIARSSETLWRFNSDGTLTRILITRNLADQVGDSQIATGRFRVDGTVLIIEYLTPTPGTTQLDLRIDGSTLFLGGQQFLRIP